ncbi:MAG: hypothetical protein WCG19_09495 [Chlorobiaceae bacterium]
MSWFLRINQPQNSYKMKKNFIAGVIVSLAVSGLFGGVSFAADKAADTKPAVTTEAKADAPAPKAKKKSSKKKATKKSAKKADAKPADAAAPAAK